jgi:Rrf2 family protein
MQITRATDYAVRIMIHLAALPEDTRVAAPELARGIQAPEAFVSKVLQQLVQRGMVTSHRGSGGGFQLAVVPESVSLLDVVEMVEGPLQINLCLAGEASCDRSSWCGAHPIWNEAQAALKNVLASASIARLARESMANLANEASKNPNGNIRIQPAEPVRRKRHPG